MINMYNLRKIYNFIKALPDEKVVMDDWQTYYDKIDPETVNDPHAFLHSCGTAACIVGWLPVIFNEEGPDFFEYSNFSDKVKCSVQESVEICHWNTTLSDFGIDDPEGRIRTKADALQAMEDLAKKYGYEL